MSRRRWFAFALALLLCCALSDHAFASDEQAIATTPELGPRVSVTLQLVDGREVVATTLGFSEEALRIRAFDGPATIPFALIASCSWGEHRITGSEIPAAMDAWMVGLAARYPHPPSPLLVGAASAIFPGAGHLLLGEWSDAARYGLLESVFLGTSVFLLFTAQAGAVLPVLALDLTLRAVTVSETGREAQRRRPSQVVLD